jgi:hypothetical protein
MTRRIVPWVALAATVFIGGCSPASAPSVAPATATPAAASQQQSIHVLEDPVDWTDVKVGSLSGCSASTCLGDYLVGRSRMLDASTNKEVGTLLTECFVVDAGSERYHCPSTTIELTDRGQIVFTEDAYIGQHRSAGDYPVIGGTGEFLCASGVVTTPADSTAKYGDFVITLTK